MLTLDSAVDFFEGLMPRAQAKGYWLTFERLLKVLKARRVRGAFAGALALNAHGVRRETEDIDFLVLPEDKARLLDGLSERLELQQDYDTLVIFRDPDTGTDVDVLVPFDAISREAVTDAEPGSIRGRRIRVIGADSLAAMKIVAAVDSPGSELKQRSDVEQLIRREKIDARAVARLLLDEAGPEYARLFKATVEHAKIPEHVPPRRRGG